MSSDGGLHQILLVDDDEAQGIIARRHLGNTYFSVIHVMTMEEARTALQESNFALVIQDLRMPPLFGVDAVEEIKKMAPKMPILVLTENSNESLITAAVEAGAHGYMLKDEMKDEEALRRRVIEMLARDRYHDPYLDAFLSMTMTQKALVDDFHELRSSVNEKMSHGAERIDALAEAVEKDSSRSIWGTAVAIVNPEDDSDRKLATRRTAEAALTKIIEALVTAGTLAAAWLGLGGPS